jgi:RNA polymerase sigma factor (sigma-70 family)
VEASALQAPAGLSRTRGTLGASLLRLRSDEQLVALFRDGDDEAFRVIHDRYRQRLFAYTRQMLPGSRQDAEDALQDVFVRAYSGLRSSERQLALRAWLYRVAHNRCIDELRRPALPAPELIELVRAPIQDPIAQAEQRESLRRLIADVRRLPEQQRSALLMRELSGMSYSELAAALAVSVPAVKSLLVRARVSLAQAIVARETACSQIRDELILAHDRRVRPGATARRHLRDCAGCREFRTEIRGVSRQLAALVPAIGPVGLLANALGIGGGAGGGAAAGSGAAAAGTGGAFAASGALATGATHVATLLAATIVTAGGAIEIQNTIAAPHKHHAQHHAKAALTSAPNVISAGGYSSQQSASVQGAASAASATQAGPVTTVSSSAPTVRSNAAAPAARVKHSSDTRGARRHDPNSAAINDGAMSEAAALADGTSTATPPAASTGTTDPNSTAGAASSTPGSSTGTGTGSDPTQPASGGNETQIGTGGAATGSSPGSTTGPIASTSSTGPAASGAGSSGLSH